MDWGKGVAYGMHDRMKANLRCSGQVGRAHREEAPHMRCETTPNMSWNDQAFANKDHTNGAREG